MLSALDSQGRLVPPVSHQYAVERVKQLLHEIAKIEKQLVDPQREKQFNSAWARLEWRGAAMKKVEAFRSERYQLTAWLNGWAEAKEALKLEIEKQENA